MKFFKNQFALDFDQPLWKNDSELSLAEMRKLKPEEYVELVKKDFKYWRTEAKLTISTDS